MITLDKRQCTTAVVGLLFSWVFFPAAMMSGFFPTEESFSLANELILAAIIVLCFGAFLARKMTQRLIPQRFFLTTVTAINLLGYGILLGHTLGLLGSWSITVAAFLLGASYVGLMFSWAELLSRIEPYQMMVLVFTSVLAYAIFTLCDFLPTEICMILCALSLPLSAGCWHVTHIDCRATFSTDVSTLRHAPLLLLGVLAVLLIGGRIVGGLFFSLANSISFLEMAVRCICISIVMAMIIHEIRRKPSMEDAYRNAWMPAAVAFFCGTMLILGLRGSYVDIGLGLMHGALSCFEALALLILFQFINNDRVSPVMVMSIGLPLFKAIPIALQRVVVSQKIVGDSMADSYVAPIIILVSCAVLVSTLAIANQRRATAETSGFTAEEGTEASDHTLNHATSMSLEEACSNLARESGLSHRETEIMELIARGHSQKHISEVLYLALGTVQWYAKTIYRKLDVHSKQELINKVNQRMEQ